MCRSFRSSFSLPEAPEARRAAHADRFTIQKKPPEVLLLHLCLACFVLFLLMFERPPGVDQPKMIKHDWCGNPIWMFHRFLGGRFQFLPNPHCSAAVPRRPLRLDGRMRCLRELPGGAGGEHCGRLKGESFKDQHKKTGFALWRTKSNGP